MSRKSLPPYAHTEPGRRVYAAISQAEREILASLRASKPKPPKMAPTNTEHQTSDPAQK